MTPGTPVRIADTAAFGEMIGHARYVAEPPLICARRTCLPLVDHWPARGEIAEVWPVDDLEVLK